MAKSLKDVLKGVKASSKVKNDLGGYKPKAGDEADFAAKHEIEKHEDRVGNGDDIYQATNIKYALGNSKEKHHGYKKPQDAKVNESKKVEDVSCNHTPAGTKCPMHEMADCSMATNLKEKNKKKLSEVLNTEAWTVTHADGSTTEHPGARDALKASRNSPGSKVGATHGAMGQKAADVLVTHKANVGSFGPWGYRPPEKKKKVKEEVEAIDELSTDLLHRAAHKAAKVAMTDVQGRSGPIFKKRAAQANKFRAKGMEQEKKEKAVKEEAEQIDELSKETLKSYVKKVDQRGEGVKRGTGLNTASQKIAKQEPTSTLKKTVDAIKKTPHGKMKSSSVYKFGASHAELQRRGVKEETLDEVLTKSTTAGETIHDFVHSDNPKFKGKSKEKRKEMALAAYYAKQRNEETDIEENGPVAPVPTHLDAHGIAKKYKDYVSGGGTPDTASRYKSHVNMLSKKTGQHPDAINKQVRKHVKKMDEDLAVPLLQGDNEGVEMVKAELKALANKAMHLVMQMPESMHVEPWCQAKIAQAKSMISDVHDYMIYGDHKEEDEQVDTPMDMTSASNPTNSLPNMSVDVGRNV